jgi:hypothetical protein
MRVYDTTAAMRAIRTRSSRAHLALMACALWLGGVEAMPALHEALHGQLAPHRHDSGSIITVSFADTTHRHPDGTIHFATAKPRAHRAIASDGQPHARELGHHADGLAHHAAALAPAPPPITQPLPIDRRPITLAVCDQVELVRLDPLAATARGPPARA